MIYEKCWFNHNDYINTSKNENNENGKNANEAVMEKLFQMMEKFAQQIMEIKERNDLK